MEREIFFVMMQKGGFLGNKRYSYREGTTVSKGTTFQKARPFSRYQDANTAAKRHGGHVLTCKVEALHDL